ncbi:hypothetical protein QZH41_015156, partial [Actinostola sp. cb2023]
SQDIVVGNRNGFPVITIPLPSRRELCEFTLRPLGETVRDFLNNIKDEDGGKIPDEYSREIAKAKTLIHQLYSSLNIEEHQSVPRTA